MQVKFELPEDIALGLESRWKDLPRAAPESLALEAYRSHFLSAAELRRLLGFETRMQVDGFLRSTKFTTLRLPISKRIGKHPASSKRAKVSAESASNIILGSPTARSCDLELVDHWMPHFLSERTCFDVKLPSALDSGTRNHHARFKRIEIAPTTLDLADYGDGRSH